MAAADLTRLRACERLDSCTWRPSPATTCGSASWSTRQPLRRGPIYRYLSTCEPVEVDVTVLSVADRLATLGRNSDRAVALHLDLAREVLPARSRGAGSVRAHRSRGDELAGALEITPGPQLGRCSRS